MAFFLLGRVDDTLTLLCPDTFASRQDAMGALSRVTSEPGFGLWDAEVLLLDTESGTPVLLMRPAGAGTSAATPAPDAPEDEVVVVSDVAEEPLESVVVEEPLVESTETDEPLVVESTDVEEPLVVDDEFDESDSDALVPEPTLEPEVEATEVEMVPELPVPVVQAEPEVETEPEVAELVEAEGEPVADAAIADAIIEEQLASEDEYVEPEVVSLKDALTRTAAQMESEGIVAPDSVASPESLEVGADAAWPWDVSPGTPDALVPESDVFMVSDLEEPALDDGSILNNTIDDDMFAAARPVIMGSYAKSVAEPIAETEPSIDPISSLLDDLVVEPMGITAPVVPARTGFAVPVVADAGDLFPVEASPEASDEVAGAEVLADSGDEDTDDSRDISDFILDLGPSPAAEPGTSVASELDEYTCKDCVYEETCPNKDQRLPKDCGSFQWR